jgi:hypothetical protein
LNYLATEESAGVVVAVESAGTTGVTGTSTGVESAFGASVSDALLQAAKDTDTIANAKITFFILCFV